MVIIRILAGLINAILHVAATGLTHLTVLLAALLTTAAVITLIVTVSGTSLVEILRLRRNRKP